MKIIDWNISYANRSNNKFEYLKNALNKKTIVIMQEVTLKHYKELKEAMRGYNIRYSLDYRKPGKFDSKQRQLGIAIITTKDLPIISAKCIDRCLLPDRTLLVKVQCGSKTIKVLGLHSITGCDHKKAKSMQFLSFAETIDKYKPDIVGIDANEPNIDGNNVNKMVFFDNKDKGKGAQTFFETLVNNNLIDAYSQFGKNKEGEPLAVSHKINGKIDKRYDFIFTNRQVVDCEYLYDAGIKYGSDHALVVCNIKTYIRKK